MSALNSFVKPANRKRNRDGRLVGADVVAACYDCSGPCFRDSPHWTDTTMAGPMHKYRRCIPLAVEA